jgi:cleavage stimulation factor subunit 2
MNLPPKRPANPNSAVLYVGSIPFDWDEAIVKSVVAGSGNITDVRLGYDYAGKNKGFCFIEYQTPQWAQQATILLNQVKLVYPNNQIKKLRIESSKESLKSTNGVEIKQVLSLDRSRLPPYVQLPPQMLAAVPLSAEAINSPGPSHYNGGGSLPDFPNNTMNNVSTTNSNTNFNFNSSNDQMSQKLTLASRSLPQPNSLPFDIPDNINTSLSQLPPPQLIELIANLKNMVNGPDANRVYDVFQMSPNLATTAAQALLLMGFIDGDVISESMKAPGQAPPPPPVLQPYTKPYPQQPMGHPPVPQQSFQSNYQNNYNQPPPPPPPPPVQSKWPNLPPSTQQKLMAMPSDQAELIVQVLNLPPDQIRSLPPDKQSMVEGIRSQYL